MSDHDGNGMLDGGFDPQSGEHLELQGDALNDGDSVCASGAGSRFSLTSRASPPPRASHRGRRSLVSAVSLGKRRGRNEAGSMKQPVSRQREGSVGSVSPADSQTSSLGVYTPAQSVRSASSAAPSLDPRGDQELLQLMSVGDPLEFVCLDLSLAPKKTKKSLKSLQSLAEFVHLAELNVANNAVAAFDGVEVFTELTVLSVSRNHIKRLDAPLFALANLQSLDLSGNFISHIPRSIAALEVLEELNLSGNNLSALKEIDTLGKLVNLQTCNMAANPFCKLPTYKDYAVSKLLSLEKLDDSPITDQVREKSRRRFNEEMFPKDKCLRDAGAAFASEQAKLREMQRALEAENVKLKDELQLKSKLLQNKSKAWSNATEQLLQLQNDLAMMNLDRRRGHAATDAYIGGMAYASDDDDPTSNQPELAPTKSHLHSHAQNPISTDPQRSRSHSPTREDSRSPDLTEPGDHQRSWGMSPTRGVLQSDRVRIRDGSSALVDAACSPIPPQLHREDLKPRALAVPDKEKPPPRSPQKRAQRQAEDIALHRLGMLSPQDFASRLHLGLSLHGADDGEYGCDGFRGTCLQLRTFEDDSGCPAYDELGLIAARETYEGNVQGPVSSHERSRGRAVEEPSPLHSPRSHRMWERQRAQLAHETTSKVGSPRKTPKRSQVLGLVEKENLIRQIQALQSCKQSFLSEIAKEEQLLHELKRESTNYANQIERLQDDLHVLAGTTARGGRASQQRDDETTRAKLEMLRSKLHYAEDKEGQIEATIVRLTKRVLEEDIQHAKEYGRNFVSAQAAPGPFDKEIFALTHNLQLVIVEKEEIHSEMSRLMNQLRGVSTTGPATTGLSAEALLLIDQHEQLQRVSADNQPIFLEKQSRIDGLKRKLRDVHDRIKIKEDQLASLVGELKDVESELIYINEMTPQTPGVHRRSLSLDSMPSSSGDILETTNTALCAVLSSEKGFADPCNAPVSSRMPSSSPRKTPQDSTTSSAHESISNMVDAAAADVNCQFEQKFNELFSPDVLEAIKQDIYDKLARQLQGSAGSLSATKGDKMDLHAAIAAALDVHIQNALGTIEKQPDDGHHCAEAVVPPSSSPKKQAVRGAVSASQPTQEQGHANSPNDRSNERACWDEVDDFIPISEATYVAKYRFVKAKGSDTLSPTVNAKCARSASVQRLQKACERLEQAESECKIDNFSGIETDASGRKKSDLKVMIMGARDLPTSHLRTKNLDPYVALEILYPQHVRPQARPTILRLGKKPSLSQGRHAFIDESTHLPNQSFRSRTVKKSVYPVWDEEFEFAPVHSLKGYLHVRVLNDRKLSREQLVGEVKIPLRMLVDQKKVTESFVLQTSATGPDNASSRRAGASKVPNGSGTIRIQLQLSFSRIEKCKRAIDDLVTKYIDDYHQLPPFIERICEYEARLAEPSVTTGQEGVHDQVEGDSKTKPLPSYESWKAQQLTTDRDVEGGRQESTSLVIGVSKPEAAIESVHTHSKVLSAARSAALWSTPPAVQPTTEHPPDINAAPCVGEIHRSSSHKEEDPRTGAATTRTTKPLHPSSHGGKKVNISTSAKAAMAQLRHMVSASKSTPASTIVPHTGAAFSISNNSTTSNRRKTMNSAVPVPTSGLSPDCFDDYSPYHPDFQLLDPLGVETMSVAGGNHAHYGKARSTSYTGGLGSRGMGSDSRRTDLRIFKSPGFSRREPSGGFPERFIGLDTQTSERIKRIFGRIDSQA